MNDNGYKVYWENAVQIIAPHDVGISASIQENLEVKTWDGDSAYSSPLRKNSTYKLIEAYFGYLQGLCNNKLLNASCGIQFVNTSMHGVSHLFMERGFNTFGFPRFIPVEKQKDPNPDFPTVKFPNPEEKGALNLSMETAKSTKATYILAQDPDSDRFSAAQRRPDDKWIIFTGDQLGVIFAARVLELYKASGKPLDRLAMVASTVSSKMVGAMANIEGFKFVECLTGFKFIGNTALDLTREGFEVQFGYEEAIGFMISTEIRDKDGVSASLFFAELATDLHRRGADVYTYLQELYKKYGFFQTSNSYFTCHSPAKIDHIFARLRNYNNEATSDVPSFPKSIGGLKFTSVRDLTIGYDSTNPPTFKPTLPLSSGHMIQFRAEGGEYKASLTIRTSGTEPKIKYYLEGSGKDSGTVNRMLEAIIKDLETTWMEAELNGLVKP